MARKRKNSLKPKNIFKYIPLFAIFAVVVIGIVFSIFDYYGILSYEETSTILGLYDSNIDVEGEVRVHFIDVGQGDCELIQSGSATVLIDAGETDCGQKVCAYLKSLNISKLDYIIATHPHADHIGGLTKVINSFEVGNIIMPEIPDAIVPNTKTYRSLLVAINTNNLKIIKAVPMQEYDLGGISNLKILGPITQKSDNLNNYSVVCMLTHGKNKFLFTGDAEAEEEDDIMQLGEDLKADVLKVGHHGSSSSSQQEFLEEVDPKYCVISVGAENSYNHPNEKVIARLEDFTNEIYRTDLLGTIAAQSDGNDVEFIFEKGS